MTTDELRAKFEAWCKSRCWDIRRAGGQYAAAPTQHTWEGCQFGHASRDTEIEALKRDAERYRHIRSTAFREFDAYGMWLRFSAIRHYDGPSDRLNEKFVDRLVDEAREAAMAKESGE